MKDFCHKLGAMLKTVFGYGILICLFAGGATFFGYVAALIIGGDAAAAICHFLYKVLMPWIIRCSTLMVVLGLIAMYLSGEMALTAAKKTK